MSRDLRDEIAIEVMKSILRNSERMEDVSQAALNFEVSVADQIGHVSYAQADSMLAHRNERDELPN